MQEGINLESQEQGGVRKEAEVNGIRISLGAPAHSPSELTIWLVSEGRNLGVGLGKSQDPEEAFKTAVNLALETANVEDLQLKLTLALSEKKLKLRS